VTQIHADGGCGYAEPNNRQSHNNLRLGEGNDQKDLVARKTTGGGAKTATGAHTLVKFIRHAATNTETVSEARKVAPEGPDAGLLGADRDQKAVPNASSSIKKCDGMDSRVIGTV